MERKIIPGTVAAIGLVVWHALAAINGAGEACLALHQTARGNSLKKEWWRFIRGRGKSDAASTGRSLLGAAAMAPFLKNLARTAKLVGFSSPSP